MGEMGSVVEPTLPDALMVRVGTVMVGRVVVVARPSGLALMVPIEVRVRELAPVYVIEERMVMSLLAVMMVFWMPSIV